MVCMSIIFFLVSSFYCLSMTKSKLSVHTSMGTNSWKIVQNGIPRVIKLLDSFSMAEKIKEVDGSIVIVGRTVLSTQPSTGDPTQAANDWWEKQKSTINQFPNVDYWEGYNEPGCDSIDQMNWYTQFEIARLKILTQNNKKACIGNFATGTPDVTKSDMIKAFLPAIDEALSCGGILGLHEYNAPFMNCTFSGDVKTGEGWLTGRYRKLYDFFSSEQKKIPLVITENGIDMGVCPVTKICPHTKKYGGWKEMCDFWSSKGLGDCNDAYMNQLEWYDQVLMSDNYVIGSTIFSLEIFGWDSWDIAPLTDIFIQYLQSKM